MTYLFVLIMCALALLFVISKAAEEIIKWMIDKIMDLKDGIESKRVR